MSFLGLFKSKKEKEFEKIQDNIFNETFPGGYEQIDADVEEIKDILDSEYTNDRIRDIYINVATRVYICEDKSEERIVEGVLMQMDHVPREDAVLVYEYVVGKSLSQKLGLNNSSEQESFTEGLFGGEEGCDSDEIPGSYGEYGYTSTNPIPTKGVMGSKTYLSALRIASDNSKVELERVILPSLQG